MILLKSEVDELWMSDDDLSQWRIVPPKSADYHHHEGLKYFKISKFDGVEIKLDKEMGALAIDLPAHYFLTNYLLNKSNTTLPNPAPNGGFLNYYFFATGGESVKENVDATLDFGLFNKFGTGKLSVLGRNLNSFGEAIRLDTTWTIDKPFNMASVRFGDSISRGGMWGTPIRFGGVQWSTNFLTQPGFVTTPLLNFNAASTLPSTLDLFINNVDTYQQQVSPGPFSINNVPLISGAGEARLVVRDIFGQEQVLIQPFYISRTLLREGLTDYSYEVGAERLNYAVRSNDYDRVSASATHRYGFSNQFTGEFHADAQKGRASIGFGGVYRVGYFGVLDGSIATSVNEKGDGQLAVIGFERQSNNLSFGLRTQLASSHFSYQGMRENDTVPSSLTNAFVGLSFRNAGSLSVNYLKNNYRNQLDEEIVSLNYNNNISRDWFLNMNAFKSIANDNHNIGLNLVYILGPRTSVSLSTNKTQSLDQTQLQVQQSLPVGPGYGYRFLAEDQNNKRLEAGVSYQNDFGTYSIEASKMNNTTQYRGFVSGSVARVDGENYFARQLGESFAIVDVPGYSNVDVFAQNQLIGTTNKDGKILVPRLKSYEKSQISIDPKQFPIEAEIEEFRLEAVPYFRSADYVRFAINNDRSAELRLVLIDNTNVPSGAMVRFADSLNQTASYPVGANGQVYMRGFKSHSHLVATWEGGRCEADVDYLETEVATPDLGVFVCK